MLLHLPFGGMHPTVDVFLSEQNLNFSYFVNRLPFRLFKCPAECFIFFWKRKQPLHSQKPSILSNLFLLFPILLYIPYFLNSLTYTNSCVSQLLFLFQSWVFLRGFSHRENDGRRPEHSYLRNCQGVNSFNLFMFYLKKSHLSNLPSFF